MYLACLVRHLLSPGEAYINVSRDGMIFLFNSLEGKKIPLFIGRVFIFTRHCDLCFYLPTSLLASQLLRYVLQSVYNGYEFALNVDLDVECGFALNVCFS